VLSAPERLAAYAALVRACKGCRACTGLINAAECGNGFHDSDHIGPWSLWQGNLNADLLIVGQDWGDTGYFMVNRGHEKPGNRTNETLRTLLRSVGIEISAPDANDAGGGAVFLTNAVLCLKGGGMQAKTRPDWFANCGARFLKPTIALIAPIVIVTLGERAYRAVTGAYGVPRVAFRTAVEEPDGFALPDISARWFPMYHCGARILNTHRPLTQQRRDWERVERALRKR
jgi:uracil-DNA glycosylase